MLRLLMWKEFREDLFSLRFAILMIVLMGLVGAIMFVLTIEHDQQVQDYTRRVELHRRAGPDIVIVDRPPPMLAILFRGFMPMAPTQIELSASAPPEPRQAVEIDSMEALFPTIDLTFCIGVVLGLIALLFSYDTITGEKERGTLRQMLAHALPRSSILLGKWLAVCGTMTVTVLIVLLMAVALAHFLSNSLFSLTRGELAALGLIALTSALYLSTFALIGICISALVKRSTTALASTTLIWVAMIFIWPNITPYVAARLTPAPTYQQFARERNRLDAQLTHELKARHARGAERVRRERMNREQALRVFEQIQRAWEREHKAALTQLENAFRARLWAQERTGMWLASLSPYGSFLHAVTALSDTGLDADERFRKQARLYDRQQEVKTITSAERHKPDLASSFTFEATPLRERFSAAAPPTLILILYNLGWLIASTLAFRRTDVR